MVVPGYSGIRAVSSFSSVIFGDLAIRGFAISFLTLARVALPDCFLLSLYTGMSNCHAEEKQTKGECVPI
jgi:hypothetical protein